MFYILLYLICHANVHTILIKSYVGLLTPLDAQGHPGHIYYWQFGTPHSCVRGWFY